MLKARSKIKTYAEIVAFCGLLFAAVMLSANRKYQNSVTSGIELWAAAVLPALFPYLIITSLVSSLNITEKIANALSPVTTKLFNVNGNAGYALFISLMSGYPVGAKCVSDLKTRGLVGDAESVRAAALCSSSSPVFLIGSVGNLTFNNPLFGLALFITHILSVFIVGFIFSFYKRNERPQKFTDIKQSVSGGNVFYESVYSAVISVLVVGGIITVFYLFTEMLSDLNVLNIFSEIFGLFTDSDAIRNGVANGLFECTKGLKILASGGISLFTLPVAAAICGFGGLSVIMQSAAYLKNAKIKTAPFFLSKTLAAVVNFIIGLIISFVFFA